MESLAQFHAFKGGEEIILSRFMVPVWKAGQKPSAYIFYPVPLFIRELKFQSGLEPRNTYYCLLNKFSLIFKFAFVSMFS